MTGRIAKELEWVDSLGLGVGADQRSQRGHHLAVGCIRGCDGVDEQPVGQGLTTGQSLRGGEDRALDPGAQRGVDRVGQLEADPSEPLVGVR